MPKRPNCKGERKDGSACNTYAEDNGYCRHHQDQAADPEDLAATCEAITEAEWVEAAAAPNALAIDENGDVHNTSEPPKSAGNARQRWQQDYDAEYDEALQVVREARKATTLKRVTCPNPKCKLKHEVEITDHKTALDAVKLYSQLALGRLEAADKNQADPLRDEAQQLLDELNALTDEELAKKLDTLTDPILAATILVSGQQHV